MPEAGVTHYWVSCVRFTITVSVDSRGKIVRTAPIVQKFLGEQFITLVGWMRGLGGFEMAVLDAQSN